MVERDLPELGNAVERMLARTASSGFPDTAGGGQCSNPERRVEGMQRALRAGCIRVQFDLDWRVEPDDRKVLIRR